MVSRKRSLRSTPFLMSLFLAPLPAMLLGGAVRADDAPPLATPSPAIPAPAIPAPAIPAPAIPAPATPAPNPPSLARPRTMAEALVAAQPLKTGVALAVAADRVSLPKDAVLAGVRLTVLETAATYGQLGRTFGTVTAVGPPTMVVINADPSDPNPYLGMPPSDALALLCSSLDDAQWKAR